MSEEALMAAYVAGDAAAFDALFEALAPRVHAFLARSVGAVTADDLLQTTFLKVHRARAEWDPARPLRPWVFAIAARVRLDELRRRRALPAAATEDELAAAEDAAALESSPDPEADLDRRDRGARVRAALDALPESQRTVIHLHRFEGLGFAEIAGVLGTTEGAVKLRAFRGYERLRAALAGLVREGEAR